MTSLPNWRLPKETLTEVVETTDSLILTHRYRDALALWMYIPVFLTSLLFGLACAGLTIEISKLGNGLLYLLAAPAWFLWLLFDWLLLKLFWGSQSLAVIKEGIVYESRLWGWRAQSHFERSEICSVACAYGWPNATPIRDMDHSSTTSISIIIQTKKKRLRFGLMLAFDEAKYLIEKLIQAFRTDDVDANVFLRSDARVFEYVAVSAHIAKKTVGYFLIEDDGQSLTLVRTEKFALDELVGMLLINGIWNFFVVKMAEPLFGFGNPGGFAKFLNGPGWWLYLLFLVPFASFGLLLLYGLLKTIKNTFQKTSWAIHENEIVRLDRWPIGSREHRFDLPRDVRLVPFENLQIGWLAKFLGAPRRNPSNRHFELTFQKQDGTVICSIPKLVLDHVTPLKKEILSRRPRWFKSEMIAQDDEVESERWPI